MAGGNYDPRKVRGYYSGGPAGVAAEARDRSSRGIARGGQGAPSRLGGNQGGLKGGFGQSGAAKGYDGIKDSLSSRPQLALDFDVDNLGLGDLAHAAVALAMGSNPLGIAAGGLASLAGLSLGDLSDLDFGSGKPGVVSGKGPGGDSGTGGGPGTPEILRNRATLQNPTGSATEPVSAEALRTSADIQNYLTDLQRIALGKEDSQAALERFGVAPEQAMFDYRNSFPEFGDSLANLSLGEITKVLGNLSREPENFAEGGRAGDTFGSRPNQEDTTVSTDLARFTQMLSDLMMLPSGIDDGRGIENPFGGPDKPQARRPVQEATPGGLMPQTGSPFYGGDAEAFRFVMEKPAEMPDPVGREFNARPEIEVEPLAPPVAPAESTPTEDFVQPYQYTMREYETDSELLLSIRELTAFNTLTREGLSGRAAMDRVKSMTPEELDFMVEVANSPDGFKDGGSVLDVDAIAQKARMIGEEEAFPISEIERSLMSPLQEDRREQKGSRIEDRANVAEDMKRLEGVADQRYLELYDNSPNYPAGTGDARKRAYNALRSQGLSSQEAHTLIGQSINYLTLDKLREVMDKIAAGGFAGGGQVRGRRDALPMVEGDHVVPAHAVKGNEGGLASLSKKLMGNKNYDGMIRGPGGPREDAIKTRVFAAGGGIAGKMDNLQNPFNSVPARVSDKEYVIPRQAITNLGMMNGAREGDANKAGQDIIYQLVENLKRKA